MNWIPSFLNPPDNTTTSGSKILIKEAMPSAKCVSTSFTRFVAFLFFNFNKSFKNIFLLKSFLDLVKIAFPEDKFSR